MVNAVVRGYTYRGHSINNGVRNKNIIMTARTENKFSTYFCHISAASVCLVKRVLQKKYKISTVGTKHSDSQSLKQHLIYDIMEKR